MKRVLIWDLPVRIIHGVLALGVLAAYLIAETGEHGPFFVLHMVLGILVATAILLRLVWGVLGSRHARWGALTLNPRALLGYLQGILSGKGPGYVGHNPATSIFMLLAFALALGLAGTGLLMNSGVDLEEIHEVMATLLLVLAGLHVAGVLLHQLRHRDGLIRGMIDGKKVASPAEAIPSVHPMAAVALAGVVAAVGLGLLSGYDPARGQIVVPGVGWTLGEGNEEEEEEQSEEEDKERSEEDEGHDGHGSTRRKHAHEGDEPGEHSDRRDHHHDDD